MNFKNNAKENQSLMIKWRRDLHRIPELGLKLPKTVNYVKEQLDKIGVDYLELVNGNALVVTIGNKKGKCVALRADMDALPIKEETGLEFKSTNNNMHACGHDAHTAILLGAVKVFKENEEKINGKIKFLFQPGEEHPGGALPMIKEGALDNPHVDAVFGLHAGMLIPLEKGQIGVRKGVMMVAADMAKITIIGKGTHGAYPQNGIDPVITACNIINTSQTIITREISATDSVVISVGKIEGGRVFNVIPEKVEIEITIRTIKEETRQYVAKRIKEIVDKISKVYGAKGEVEYWFGYPSTVNNPEMVDILINSSKKIIEENDIVMMEEPCMASEDMSYYLLERPGAFFFFTNPNKNDGEYYPHHHPKFDIDEEYLYTASSILMQVAYDYLNEDFI